MKRPTSHLKSSTYIHSKIPQIFNNLIYSRADRDKAKSCLFSRVFVPSYSMTKKALFKICISFILLFVVLRTTDFGALFTTFTQIPLWVLGVVCGGFALGQVISAYKWCLIARASGLTVTYPVALKAYFTGMFANFFGLGLVGGDLTRALLIARRDQSKTLGLATVAADRIHGLGMLALVGSLALLLTGGQGLEIWLLLLLPGVFLGLVSVWIFGPKLVVYLVPSGNPYREKLEKITNAFPRDATTILKVSIISMMFHSLQIVLHWVMGIGVGASLSLTLLFATIPFVAILTSFPISWNGLGVRENAYSFFLAPLYLSNDQVLAFGAIWLLATTVSSGIGGILGALSQDFSKLKKESVSSETAAMTA